MSALAIYHSRRSQLSKSAARMLFMGTSLALAVVFHAMRGMYLHAERLLAKAGAARRNEEGCRPPEG